MNYLAAAAFASLLSHYKLYHKKVLKMDVDQIVNVAQSIMAGCGQVSTPIISQKLAEELGMVGHPALKIAHDLVKVPGEEDDELSASLSGEMDLGGNNRGEKGTRNTEEDIHEEGKESHAKTRRS